MKLLRAVAGVLIACGVAWSVTAHAEQSADVIVHMLDYVAVDYSAAVRDGKVVSAAEFEEMQDFTRQAATQLQALPTRAQQATLLEDARTLAQRVHDKAAPSEIGQRAGDLRRGVIAAYGIVVAPRGAPDLAAAAPRYESLCAGCHGATGKGDGTLAKGLDPTPSNFHDDERMRARSVYGLYSTISLGVSGTSMPSFATLSEDERWALAFHVAGLRTS